VTTATLRPATPDDLPDLVALEAALFARDAWGEAEVHEELSGPGRRSVVADAEGAVVGYAVTRLAGDVVDLQRIAVAPDHRRAGLGHRLLDHLVVSARADGADRMLLEVSDRNTGAVAFYGAEGFTRLDVRRRYYRDGSDALVLSRPLLERP
jgi:ribosomal-protein-alanine N-acetyltransferase